jgi:hypothetical protein
MSDTDFEQGSIAAANAIFGWIGRTYGPTMQRAAVVAWDAGDMFEPEVQPTRSPHLDATLTEGEIKPPVFDRRMAKQSGYTGDECTNCHGVRVKNNGTCLVCEDCGTTTGCS